MKKIIKLTLILSIITFSYCNAQIAYYDAMKLKTIFAAPLTDESFGQANAILTKYDCKNCTDPSQIQAKFATNPFIPDSYKSYTGSSTQSYIGAKVIADMAFFSNNTNSGSALASIGNLDVTNLADGIAKFLVKRGKEELSVTFFEKFDAYIAQYPDARALFPQTFATLQTIGQQIYNYGAFINALRTAFEKDINGILSNLPAVINNPQHATFFANHGDLKDIILSAIYIGSGLQNKQQPGQIIASYDVNTLLHDVNNKDIKACIQTLQLISASLRYKDTSQYWISSDDLQLLVNDNDATKYYLALIYQQSASIGFSRGSLQSTLQNNAATITAYDTYILGFIQQASTIITDIKTIKTTKAANLTFTDYYGFYNSALDMIQYAANASKLPGLSTIDPNNKFASYITLARAGGNIAFDINRKNYSSAIMNAYTIYNNTFKTDTDPNTQKVISDLMKYGTFVASVAQAQNSDDVENAIEATVLPPGSASIKRETNFNIAINGFIGAGYGTEYLPALKTNKWGSVLGVTAPVGVAFSWGDIWGDEKLIPDGKGKTTGGKSFSIFVSLIDVGALASYRLQNDSSSVSSQIKLQNIVSPGLFFYYGFGKMPISLGLGAQYGPQLRSISSGGVADVQQNYYIKIGASLVVDIPLFNIYTKPK
ncbi:MAG: hypothetical protein ACHQHN_15510 [Sphingobacteriales bacterium]